MTNLNKTREEIIYELVLSLNNGNNSYIGDRVEIAIRQYDEFVRHGVIKECKCCSHKWEAKRVYDCLPDKPDETNRIVLYVCSHCGETQYRKG